MANEVNLQDYLDEPHDKPKDNRFSLIIKIFWALLLFPPIFFFSTDGSFIILTIIGFLGSIILLVRVRIKHKREYIPKMILLMVLYIIELVILGLFLFVASLIL